MLWKVLFYCSCIVQFQKFYSPRTAEISVNFTTVAVRLIVKNIKSKLCSLFCCLRRCFINELFSSLLQCLDFRIEKLNCQPFSIKNKAKFRVYVSYAVLLLRRCFAYELFLFSSACCPESTSWIVSHFWMQAKPNSVFLMLTVSVWYLPSYYCCIRWYSALRRNHVVESSQWWCVIWW